METLTRPTYYETIAMRHARTDGHDAQSALRNVDVDRGPAHVGLVDLLALQAQHLGHRRPADVDVQQPNLRGGSLQGFIGCHRFWAGREFTDLW